jgi:hypothetical protein
MPATVLLILTELLGGMSAIAFHSLLGLVGDAIALDRVRVIAFYAVSVY